MARRIPQRGKYMIYPVRKHPRLKNYDYGQAGCYHLTICTKNRRAILSKIIPAVSPAERAVVQLLPCGIVAQRYIQNIPNVYRGVHLIKYVIMPNHIHLLVALEQQSSANIPTIINSVKRLTSTEIKQSIWQDSFFDVVIRNDAMFRCEWAYIDNNPDKWIEDELYMEEA